MLETLLNYGQIQNCSTELKDRKTDGRTDGRTDCPSIGLSCPVLLNSIKNLLSCIQL